MHAATGDPPIRRFARPCALPSSRLPGRHDGLHPGERARAAAAILKQPAAHRDRGGGHPPSACRERCRHRGTQQEDRQRRLEQQPMVHRMAVLLAAIPARRLSRLLGRIEAPFGAIMAQRREAGGSTGGDGSWGGTISAVASTAATPRHFVSSVTARLGASPSGAASPVGRLIAHESPDGLCSGPSRTAALTRRLCLLK